MKTAIIALFTSSAVSLAEPMKPEFQYVIFIAKPAKEVWNALTEKSSVDQYFLAPLRTLELRKGGKISYGGDNDLIVGTILEVEAPKTLVHTFQFPGQKGNETRVAYEIKAIGELMSSLSITHTGFDSKDQSFADVSGGWPVIASSLKTVLETGRGLPWPK